MPIRKIFGSRELCKCLECLGCRPQQKKATAHLRYKLPPNHPLPKDGFPFIPVVLGKGSYDPVTCKKIISQIKSKGFTEKEIEKCLQ